MATYAYRSISERQKIQSLGKAVPLSKRLHRTLTCPCLQFTQSSSVDMTAHGSPICAAAMMRNWHSSLSKNLLNGGAAKLPRHNRSH